MPSRDGTGPAQAVDEPASYPAGVALLSPCGWGNLGDAAIVDSVIHALRVRLPNAPIVGLTLNPPDTVWRHGIPAFTCSGFSFGDYGVSDTAFAAAPASRNDPMAEGPNEAHGDGPGRRSFVWRAARQIPGLPAAWRTARLVRADLRHRQLLAGPTKRLAHVVVAGGGQLDDFWGGPLAHPYVLWRWAQRAKAVGARFLVLSVGTGTLSTPLSRWLVRGALSAADYRSFRDEGSRKLVGDPLVEGDPIVPDLAYGLPVETYLAGTPALRSERPLLGLSPIAHCDPRVGPVRDAERYRSYLRRLAMVAGRLLETGHDLVLYGTDGADNAAVADLREEIANQGHAGLLDRVAVPKVTTVRELFSAVGRLRAVIASRMHGVLLPQLAGVPVVALSYERKVATLMKAVGCQGYCVEVDSFNPPDVLDLVRKVLDNREEVSAQIGRVVSTNRRHVEDQYDRVFGAGT